MTADKTVPMLRNEIVARVGEAKTLPTLNGMMNKVFSIMNDVNASFSQLFNVVRYDQAIASKIIGIANSTYYSRGAAVTGLERAMILVGLEEIKRIIMCLVFMKGTTAQWKLDQEDIAAIWGHSLTVAHCAKTLAANMMIEEPDAAFTISILLDIGKVVFYTYKDHYGTIVDEANVSGTDICELEREAFGIDHQEVGHSLSTKWGFPEVFSEAILGHHGLHTGENPLMDVLRDAEAFASGRNSALPERERTILEYHKELIEAESERIKQLVGLSDRDRTL